MGKMVVQVHGFDWEAYAKHIMPAFEQWLIQRDDSEVYRLFKETRCAREEALMPAPLQHARLWLRAKSFADTLPRGPYSRREYQKLCSADQFTSLSDRYMYKHAPQLYKNPTAIRTIWGALIDTYCLPWNRHEQTPTQPERDERARPMFSPPHVERSEVLSLLHRAGFGDLAREIDEQVRLKAEQPSAEKVWAEPETLPRSSWPASEATPISQEETRVDHAQEDEVPELEDYTQPLLGGISLGMHPNTLQLRGWLAGLSVRTLVLFEYLACGRRWMPFGYEPSEPYGIFIGYLTPDEVWQLGIRLRGVQDPAQAEAETDYLRFRYQHPGLPESARLIDEILPCYAADFHHAVDMAAAQGLGLICSTP